MRTDTGYTQDWFHDGFLNLREDAQVILPPVHRHVDVRAAHCGNRCPGLVPGEIGKALAVGVEQIVEFLDEFDP